MDTEVKRRQVLAQAVRREMADRGWEQSDLVANCGISAGTVSNLLRGQVSISPQTLRKLAQCLNWSDVALNRLFYGEVTVERQVKLDQIEHRLRQLSPGELDQAIRVLDALFETAFLGELQTHPAQSEGSGPE